MDNLKRQACAFTQHKQLAATEAGQRVAVQLALGIDLADVLAAPASVRRATVTKLRRILERERLKGLRRHWSYDLNRHIALERVEGATPSR